MPVKYKSDLVQTLCDYVGESICRVLDPRDGWPGIIQVRLSDGWHRFSLHVGQISSHSRKEYEYRFQNPAKDDRPPVTVFPGTTPLLIGVWDTSNPPVLVAAEPEVRIGDTTRFSVLFPQRLFEEAQESGWAEPYRNNKGNLHWSFLPPLLPTFIELYAAQVSIDPTKIQIAAVGAGLVDDPDEGAASRARHATTRLVRDAKFGKAVVTAYDGLCAMCGINLGLVAGAHIYPVSAVDSIDAIWNGVALCENHHRAFDSHRVWIEPSHRDVRIHPAILQHAETSERSRLFVETTFPTLADPLELTHLPKPEMFVRRYEYFADAYDWA